MNKQVMTGYASIDRPWQKYYSHEEIYGELPSGSMYDYMCSCNEKRPDAYALNYFGKRISHQQLRNNVDICAKALIASGVKKGDFVSLCLLAIPEAVYLFYAINKIGAIANFLVLNATDDDMRRQIALCESRIVIAIDIAYEKIARVTQKTNVEEIVSVSLSQSMPQFLSLLMRLKDHKKTNSLIAWNAFLKRGNTSALQTVESDSSACAVIEYTGGTTGESKGVALANSAGNALAYNYQNAKSLFKFNKGERFLNILPPFFAYGLFLGIHMPLCVGTEVILSPDPSPKNFPKLIHKYKPNHFTGGPLHLDNLLYDRWAQQSDLSFIITAAYGGDKASKEWEQHVHDFLLSRHAPYGLVNGYGLTETAGACCTTTHKLKHMIPFAKNNVKILDVDSREELSYGQEGEICISGPTLMLGYHKNTVATSEVMWVENGIHWLRTGDLGYVTEEGYFVISGRLKRLFYVVGPNEVIFRVYPMKIESIISQNASVFKCSVVGRKIGNQGFVPVAFIVLHNNTDVAKALREIRLLCEKKLPETSWPCEYRVVDSLPTTGAGKVDYRELELRAQN